MYRWSKIPEDVRPEIIFDISDDSFLTLVVQDSKYNKILRKDTLLAVGALQPFPTCAAFAVPRSSKSPPELPPAAEAWEGSNWFSIFNNIIENNIPCVMMYKVKNEWASEIDTVVCFMTGECNDVFLVHPKDLTEWDPNESLC